MKIAEDMERAGPEELEAKAVFTAGSPSCLSAPCPTSEEGLQGPPRPLPCPQVPKGLLPQLASQTPAAASLRAQLSRVHLWGVEA